MNTSIQTFIAREGSLSVLSNLASHFEHYPVHDDAAREYLLIEAQRILSAIDTQSAVIN